VEVCFGISANRGSEFGGRSDTRLGSRVLNSRYPKTQNRRSGCQKVQVQVCRNPEKRNHFGISEFWVPEGIGDREFEDKPYELPVREIALTVGSRGRTIAVDFPWKRNTSVSVFQDSAYRESC
jgi:hypothetical protein